MTGNRVRMDNNTHGVSSAEETLFFLTAFSYKQTMLLDDNVTQDLRFYSGG